MQRNWNLHELLDRGRGVITDFVAGRHCSRKAEAKFDRTMDHLVQQERDQWCRPKASPLANHIYVIRFTDENQRQLRIFGHFNEPNHCFVMTLSGGEKDDEYYPANYEERASNNKRSVDEKFFERSQSYSGKCDHEPCNPREAEADNVRVPEQEDQIYPELEA